MIGERGRRILYLGTFPPHPGGSAVSSSLLIRQLAAKGHRIRVIAPTTECDTPDPTELESIPTVEVERFVMPYHESNPFVPAPQSYQRSQFRRAHEHLRRAVASERPDLIWVGRESFVSGVPRFARSIAIPSLVCARGILKLVANDVYPDPKVARHLLSEFGQSDVVVPVAEHLARDLRALGFINLQVVTNGVDIHQFAPAPKSLKLRRELKIPGHAKVIAHVSNFKPIKRIGDIVETAARTIVADPSLVYVLAGDGTVRDEAESLCRRLGLQEHFRFTGWVGQSRVADIYNLSDVVVLASESEVAPRLVLEAMASARAVVSSDIPAAREIIDDGVEGLLFRSGDLDQLTERILTLVREPEYATRLGLAARRKILCKYDIRTAGDLFEKVVLGLVERGRPERPRRIPRPGRPEFDPVDAQMKV